MGQKVNPHGLRVGVIKDWDSRWYAEDNFADYLVEDYNIRTFLKKKLYSAGVSKIEIERASDRVKVIIFTAKPGIVIGKGGAEIEKVKAELQKYTDKKIIVDIKEVKRPDRDAQLVLLESRLPYPDVWVEQIWLVPSSTVREPFRCRHFVQILTMVSLRQIPLMVKLV